MRAGTLPIGAMPNPMAPSMPCAPMQPCVRQGTRSLHHPITLHGSPPQPSPAHVPQWSPSGATSNRVRSLVAPGSGGSAAAAAGGEEAGRRAVGEYMAAHQAPKRHGRAC